MRNLRTWTLALVLVMLTLAPGCNEESALLDDPDDANSVLEVSTLQIPAATASGSVGAGTCVVNFTNVTATLANKPKSLAASGSPFNDITLLYVSLNYTWDDPAIVTPARTFSIGGTVPIGGTVGVQFAPVAFGDLTGAEVGHTANIHMVFHGIAVSGEPLQAQGGGTLSVGGVCTP